MMHLYLIDWVGIAGGATLLFAFVRISVGRWKSTSLWYELDNLVAAALLSIYSLNKGAYVSMVINVVWAVVAFRGVTSYTERRWSTKHR
jgi:hypothetical protein